MEIGAQDLEWTRAQEIVLSVDLVKADKEQLRFLAIIDGIRSLHHSGPALDHAIYRFFKKKMHTIFAANRDDSQTVSLFCFCNCSGTDIVGSHCSQGMRISRPR